MPTEPSSPLTNHTHTVSPSPDNKGKGKPNVVLPEDTSMEEEDGEEDDEEDDEDGDGEIEEDDDHEDHQEIDPRAILPRRTRGVRVDYTSEEAHKKAGLTKDDAYDDDDETMDH